jgi:hypothetical protein
MDSVIRWARILKERSSLRRWSAGLLIDKIAAPLEEVPALFWREE